MGHRIRRVAGHVSGADRELHLVEAHRRGHVAGPKTATQVRGGGQRRAVHGEDHPCHRIVRAHLRSHCQSGALDRRPGVAVHHRTVRRQERDRRRLVVAHTEAGRERACQEVPGGVGDAVDLDGVGSIEVQGRQRAQPHHEVVVGHLAHDLDRNPA